MCVCVPEWCWLPRIESITAVKNLSKLNNYHSQLVDQTQWQCNIDITSSRGTVKTETHTLCQYIKRERERDFSVLRWTHISHGLQSHKKGFSTVATPRTHTQQMSRDASKFYQSKKFFFIQKITHVKWSTKNRDVKHLILKCYIFHPFERERERKTGRHSAHALC